MANDCSFEMHARGSPEALGDLVADMLGTENADGSDRVPHMARVFEAEVTKKTDAKRRIWSRRKGVATTEWQQTWHIVGTCAWSSLVCMTHADPCCYGSDKTTGARQGWFIGLEEEATLRKLDIELHDSEGGMEFATRIIAMPNTPLVIESYDYHEIFYTPGLDDLDELTKEYGLTTAEVSALMSGDYVVRTTMPDTWLIP